MSSDQLPPAVGNFSFPPAGRVQFNYRDEFVTSWVTPEFSQQPCFFSWYYWNDSGNEPWTSQLNVTAALNDTKVVSFDFIDSDGLGQLNLNYVDPLGGHKLITGEFFHINHDTAQTKAMTWNQALLSPSSTTATSLSQTTPPAISTTPTMAAPASTDPSDSVATSLSRTTPPAISTTPTMAAPASTDPSDSVATSLSQTTPPAISTTPTMAAPASTDPSDSVATSLSQTTPPAISTKPTMAAPASTDPSDSVAGNSTPSSNSATVQSSISRPSAPPAAKIASITLGTILGIVLAIVFAILYIRRQRQKKQAKQIKQEPCIAPTSIHRTVGVMQEKDGEIKLNEMEGDSGRWELDVNNRPQ